MTVLLISDERLTEFLKRYKCDERSWITITWSLSVNHGLENSKKRITAEIKNINLYKKNLSSPHKMNRKWT